MSRIEAHFHALIRERAGELATGQTLPGISGETLGFRKRWFPVPGMYGGFAYSLSGEDDSLVLMVQSWSRVVAGSEQTHRITADGCRLLGGGVGGEPKGD